MKKPANMLFRKQIELLIFGLFLNLEFVSLQPFPSKVFEGKSIRLYQYNSSSSSKEVNEIKSLIELKSSDIFNLLMIDFYLKFLPNDHNSRTVLDLTWCRDPAYCIKNRTLDFETLKRNAECETNVSTLSQNMALLFYHGTVRDMHDSSVYLVICRKIAGFVRFNTSMSCIIDTEPGNDSNFLDDKLVFYNFDDNRNHEEIVTELNHTTSFEVYTTSSTINLTLPTVNPTSSTVKKKTSSTTHKTTPLVNKTPSTSPPTTSSTPKKTHTTLSKVNTTSTAVHTVSSAINTISPAIDTSRSTVFTTPLIDIETPKNQIRGPYKANKASKFIELALLIDNSIFQALNEAKIMVYRRYQNVVNKVNSYFQDLNIYVALVHMEILNDSTLLNSSDINTTYKNFESYANAWPDDKKTQIDIVHLISNVEFNHRNARGIANTASICTALSYGVDYDQLENIEPIAETLAHEIMHNLGVEHYNKSGDCYCSEERCIMYGFAKKNLSSSSWSSWTVDSLKLILKDENNFQCLNNKPTRIFEGPVCGNGFIEPGEKCDCGLAEKCDNTSCNATSCTLKANASFAMGEFYDLKQFYIFLILFGIGLILIGAVCIMRCCLTNHYDGRITPRVNRKTRSRLRRSSYFERKMAEQHYSPHEQISLTPIPHRMFNTTRTQKSTIYPGSNISECSLVTDTTIYPASEETTYQNTNQRLTSWVYDTTNIYSIPEPRNARTSVSEPDAPAEVYEEIESNYYEPSPGYGNSNSKTSFSGVKTVLERDAPGEVYEEIKSDYYEPSPSYGNSNLKTSFSGVETPRSSLYSFLTEVRNRNQCPQKN